MPRRTLSVFASTLIALLLSGNAWAGGGPQNFVVVVNPNDPGSLEVANAYVELRDVPAVNVIYIPFNPTQTRAKVELFRDRVLKPLLDQIKERGLTNQIDGVAFSTGYPYAIDCTQLFPGQEFPAQVKPWLSLTSAVYLSHLLLGQRMELFALNSNGYFAEPFQGKTTSRAFTADLPAAQGERAGSKAGGLPYVLATSLGVTHGRGNTAAEIVAVLRRAKRADGAKYRGTIYYMKNKDIRSRARDSGYAAAIQELTQLGVKAELLTGVVPLNKNDVAGLTTGAPQVDLRGSGSTILPGALVDNLTSSAGQFNVPANLINSQTPVSEFLRMGAAGAAGTVVEPFAIAAKFPSPHIHVHYARGCSLAEAFYQSVAGPYQMIIVGDPLCQPWAAAPKVSVEGASDGAVLKGKIQVKPSAKYPDSRAAARFELYIDGLKQGSITPGESFSIASSALADGFHELRVVAIDNTPIAVQGSWLGLVQIKNGVDAIQLSASAGKVTVGETLSVSAASTRKGEATVFNNGRQIGTIAGGSGSLAIDTNKLGKGRVQLWAEQPGKPPVRSRPLTVEVN
jgi:hypothetical protein